MDNTIAIMPIEKLINFEAQPFKVLEDDKYEIISGHRRKRACERAGIEKTLTL